MHDWFAANRRTWDERVGIHLADRTGFYAVDAVRAGIDHLGPIERAEIGELRGLSLLHLQCHFGLDSLALARRGAKVTALDFSPAAIAAAHDLARECELDVRFVEGNVYDTPDLVAGSFDRVFVTWGALCWLPDVARWARVVGRMLRPGGQLYLAEGHPSIMPLEEREGRLEICHAWRIASDKPLVIDETVTYTGDPQPMQSTRTYEWIHPLSSVIGGLLDAGLRLDWLHEHEIIPWRAFPMMVEAPQRMFRMPPGHPPLPLAYSLQATKVSG